MGKKEILIELPDELLPQIIFPSYCNTIISIDVGTKNMGVVVFEKQESPHNFYIKYLDLINLLNNDDDDDESVVKKLSINDLIENLHAHLTEMHLTEKNEYNPCSTICLIEQQPLQPASGACFGRSINNAKTSALSYALQMYCLTRSIQFETVNPKLKDHLTAWIYRASFFVTTPSIQEMEGIQLPKTRKYNQRKNDSVKFVEYFIRKNRTCFSSQALEVFENLRKKDDVSDALLQCFVKFASDTYRKQYLEKPTKKRVVNRNDDDNIDDEHIKKKRKQVKKKHIEDAENL